jgi:hypothetical protein
MTTSTNVRSAVTDDGVILMDVSNGNIFHSNPTGSFIWSKLRDGASMTQIVEAVAGRYEAPPDVLEADVREYVGALRTKGLIVAQESL